MEYILVISCNMIMGFDYEKKSFKYVKRLKQTLLCVFCVFVCVCVRGGALLRRC